MGGTKQKGRGGGEKCEKKKGEGALAIRASVFALIRPTNFLTNPTTPTVNT